MAKKDKGEARGGSKGERIKAMEARLARLEGAFSDGDWPLSPAPPGADAEAPIEASAQGLAEVDWSLAAPLLAALGHPLRLTILRAALASPQTSASLAEAMGADTGDKPVSSGQLYHHLRELTATGWLTPAGRGAYVVPAARRRRLLAVMAATAEG